MFENFLKKLVCPVCSGNQLDYTVLSGNAPTQDAVVACKTCSAWFPVEAGLLEFLAPGIDYKDDREKFWLKHETKLKELGLKPVQSPPAEDYHLQKQQQDHFDWYADNGTQTYTDYAKSPFWTASDKMAFEPWRREVKPGSWLLEVGCAQGRSTYQFMDLDIQIVAFDVSKKMIRQAMDRYEREKPKARAIFFVADANKFPFKNAEFDYVLIYGVLHHLPKPETTCRELARVLKPGGVYFGQENNHTVFRFLFDWMQKLNPLWHEEAGPESMISKPMLENSFKNTGVAVKTETSVFLPPHLVNLFSNQNAYKSLVATDKIGRSLPFLKENGGIILIKGTKQG